MSLNMEENYYKNPVNLDDKYFETLGKPKPSSSFGLIDRYRFWTAENYLVSGSVLDVGAYFGDFLIRAKESGRQIFGTEVNQERVELANQLIGEPVVQLGFRNGNLSNIKDKSIDNVVCTEVLEHTPDDIAGLAELCRVARSRVIVTVPYAETLQYYLCVHCNQYTPNSGHLHRYDLNTFSNITPHGWRILYQKTFAKKITTFIAKKLPNKDLFLFLIRFLDRFLPSKPRWLLVVLESIN